MSDVVVTVPKQRWLDWMLEGLLPGEPWDGQTESHFWLYPDRLPDMEPGDRVYIVAWGRVRGYAPLVRIERACKLWKARACLVRRADAVAVTIPTPIQGFRGWHYRAWDREEEVPYPDWKWDGVDVAR